MAKGNMFQGMARGKVGDVVFSRLNGEQISRVRNRHPKNPRTNAQLYQRAIMATVVQAYSAGKVIFDHSFQGYSVGAQNQREFIKRNTKMLRQLVATDINTPIATNSQKARVVAPGVSAPVANPFIISSGTYQQSLFQFDAATINFVLPQPTENETVAQYAARVNLIPGDIYTFVFLTEKTDVAYESNIHDDVLASLNQCTFGFVRLTVKDGLSNVNDTVATYAQLFTGESSGGDVTSIEALLPDWDLDFNIGLMSFIDPSSAKSYTGTGSIGLIRSRRDQDLRSNSVMYVAYGSTAEDMFGIASDYILDEWKSGTTSVGDSDLILEGGDM